MVMSYSRRSAALLTRGVLLCIITITVINPAIQTYARDRAHLLNGKPEKMQKGPIVDGSFVHNIGNLQMNVTNWGFFGSLPKSLYPMADQPSAQWPAGSGIEYLYAAGLWVGALDIGIPNVSTGYPETEFYPPTDSRATIYRSFEGTLGGSRPPSPADDDNDGLADEDWLNGFDDDGDGLVDEDFAAIGKQMFVCLYTDDQPAAVTIWPEHTPMNIHIRQESYQWGEEDLSNFIGVRYYVSNNGSDFLEDVYLGIYADVDAGPREYGSYYMDDEAGYWEGVWCAPKGDAEWPVRLHVGYVYDSNGDGGRTPGYFGIALLGYPTYTSGVLYKSYFLTHLHTFRIFRGLQPFEKGGEPTNDYERYHVLSMEGKDGNTEYPNDYKILMSVGPLSLPPDASIPLDIAFVCGEGLEEMLDNASIASVVYQGCFYNADGNPNTGVRWRESPVSGPNLMWYPDTCNYPDLWVAIPPHQVCWSNIDCAEELWLLHHLGCYKPPNPHMEHFATGLGGKETRVNWVTGSAPPPPNLRLLAGNQKVTLLWDNFSEIVPDPLTLDYDFEGYQIWRADNWHRPYGTTIQSGPTFDLWNLVEERDLVNGIPPDIDFRRPYPQGGWKYEPCVDLPDRDAYMEMFYGYLRHAPFDTVPCPEELTDEICDTLEAVARHNLGLDGGRQYYKYVDIDVKNGLPYFYSVTAYDHRIRNSIPYEPGRFGAPASNFKFITPLSDAQEAEEFDERKVYVVPNPVTNESLDPWRMSPNNSDLTGVKVEFRNMPKCRSTVRIYTVSGDLVQVLYHDGTGGNGTLPWNLLTRNGQDITSGIYIFSVDPEGDRFPRIVGKFVAIR